VGEVLALNLTVVGGLLPDRTFLVAIDAETASARVGGTRDRIESAGTGLWARVAEAYAALAELYPDRYVVLDGRRSIPEIAADVRDHLR
jgi:dTMP kinase